MFHLIFQPENSVLAVENALFSCSSAAGTCVEYVLRRLFFWSLSSSAFTDTVVDQ